MKINECLNNILFIKLQRLRRNTVEKGLLPKAVQGVHTMNTYELFHLVLGQNDS